jgi:hypothetical protein
LAARFVESSFGEAGVAMTAVKRISMAMSVATMIGLPRSCAFFMVGVLRGLRESIRGRKKQEMFLLYCSPEKDYFLLIKTL